VLAADEAARDALAAASAALARDRSWPQVARRHLEVYAEVAR
jgi:hypothetical protein